MSDFSVNTLHNRPSRRDELLESGLRSLGWHVASMPRNVVHCTQDDICGFCGLGCVRGAKQSMAQTYLHDAAADGARLLADCTAERLLIAAATRRPVSAPGRAAATPSRSMRASSSLPPALSIPQRCCSAPVSARRLATTCICIPSPPCGVVSTSPFNRGLVHSRLSIRTSSPISTAATVCASKLLRCIRRISCSAAPGRVPQRSTTRMRDLPHLSLIGVLLRDRSAGRVRLDRQGRPLIHYALSRYDQHHVRAGLSAAARILQAAGAHEISSSQYRPVTWHRGQSLEDWLARVDRVGYGVHETIYGSWHQMGTCRIGRAADSAVDGFGELHGVRNAYVADASLFPNASGVNPMLSVAALAYQVAQRVNARLDQSIAT